MDAPQKRNKDGSMSADTRNTRVVIFLVVAMTGGVVILRWLEPGLPGYPPDTMLMAERGGAVEELAIEYVPAGAPFNREDYDYIVEGGVCEQWQQSGPRVRMLVVGCRDRELEQQQCRKLLQVVGKMNQSYGLDLSRITLDLGSDPQQNPRAADGARRLRDLLVSKGIFK
jgi:hypothetical protein